MDALKIFIIAIVSAVVAFLEPIKNPITVLFIVFLGDMFFGIVADIVANDDRVRIKKGLFALIFLLLYSSVIVLTLVIGVLMRDLDESMIIIKSLTYIFVAFYAANTLRNVCDIFPNNRVFAFLYYIFGLQILKKMPELYNYIFGKK